MAPTCLFRIVQVFYNFSLCTVVKPVSSALKIWWASPLPEGQKHSWHLVYWNLVLDQESLFLSFLVSVPDDVFEKQTSMLFQPFEYLCWNYILYYCVLPTDRLVWRRFHLYRMCWRWRFWKRYIWRTITIHSSINIFVEILVVPGPDSLDYMEDSTLNGEVVTDLCGDLNGDAAWSTKYWPE